ncbi:hypothetical protein MRB53_034097 [Persea americana]|uniref:Uncharacterized protein n=1 Tax=Persea americana TaxID=3435 RepID=A0ACC2KWW8_PERAE|nr:hypothetical protein MRB53_034097 [Persea americana]
MEFLHQLIMGMFAFVISYHVVFKRMKRSKGKMIRKAPEPGYSWPIIGHLHLLKGPEPFHHKLSALADKLGPVFMLRLGAHRTLVVSGAEAIKECFTSKDRALASRPRTAAGEYMCYNHLMFGVAPYGSYWREVRKMSMIHLLSNHRLEMLKHVRATEIDECMKALYRGWVENDGCPVKVEMKQWLHDLNFSIVWKMVVGKQCVGVGEDDEGKELQRLTVEFFRLFMAFVVSDAFPFLKWVDWMGKKKRTMKKIAKKMDSIMGKLLKEHRCSRRAGGDKGEEGGFMDVMLSIMEDSPLPGHDTDTVIKATTLAIILSATDTTATTLAGALSAVLNNPQVLKKAQDELDTHVGRNRHVDESDIKSLTYLQAITKETLRMGPIGLLLPVHETTDDCKIGGFYVPAGTRVLVDMGKVHHDPLIWSDPDKFWPERWFLTMHRDVDVRGQQFEYLPFGSGRRSCPGISLAMQVMHLSLARLIHGFEMEVPEDAPYVDVRESLRSDNPKSTPVEILFTPRLPSHLYEDRELAGGKIED